MIGGLLGESSIPGLAAAVGRELGVLLVGIAAGVLLVRQPAKNVCGGPFPGQECVQLASFTDSLLTYSLVAGALLLVASGVLATNRD